MGGEFGQGEPSRLAASLFDIVEVPLCVLLVMLPASENHGVAVHNLSPCAPIPADMHEVWNTPYSHGSPVFVTSEPDEMHGHVTRSPPAT